MNEKRKPPGKQVLLSTYRQNRDLKEDAHRRNQDMLLRHMADEQEMQIKWLKSCNGYLAILAYGLVIIPLIIGFVGGILWFCLQWE